jgi:hypothetical protein
VYNNGANYGLDAQIFMERGQGPSRMFSAQLPGARAVGDANFEKCYGSDKTKWPFNTQCCAYSGQDIPCPAKALSPNTLVQARKDLDLREPAHSGAGFFSYQWSI